jgi:hypothetical protein
MNLKNTAKKILANRNEILEGIKNNVFKKDAVEVVANERLKICEACHLIDLSGSECAVKGTQPCCGDCGCSLKLKLRSLSSGCPKDKWEPVLTEKEDDAHQILKQQ